MPQANGTNYRTFGQGYRAEKEKQSAAESDNKIDDKGGEGKDKDAGAIAHVKHLGGGKYKMKLESADGSVRNDSAESREEREQKLDEHFGDGEQESEQYDSGDESEEDGGEALKSILG